MHVGFELATSGEKYSNDYLSNGLRFPCISILPYYVP